MQTFRISVKATALRNYLVRAGDLEEALEVWPSGTPETEEIVAEEEPVIAECLAPSGEWKLSEMPPCEYA